MKIKINSNRTIEKNYDYNEGTQFENNITICEFEIPEEYENFTKRIVFITEDGNVWDKLNIDNTYEFKNNVTKYKKLFAYIWLTKSEGNKDFRSKVFPLDFNNNENADDYVPSESQIDGFTIMLEQLNAALDRVVDTNVIEEINTKISSITDLIPEQATASNQLADKDFVNSSISTATATFRGTYNSLEELQQVEADINDYGNVIEVDDIGNEYYSRYTYDGTQWIFNFKINTTTFTSAQWKAINSNATAELIEKLVNIDLTNYVKNTDIEITNKELSSNKSQTIDDSTIKYPSNNAVKTYVEEQIGIIENALNTIEEKEY